MYKSKSGLDLELYFEWLIFNCYNFDPKSDIMLELDNSFERKVLYEICNKIGLNYRSLKKERFIR